MTLYPLTKPQQSIWNMEQFYGGSIANITGSAFFYENVDIADLQTSLNKTLEQSDSLRIRIKMQGDVPMQYVEEYKPVMFEVLHFQTRNEFDKWIKLLAQTPFDLNGNLYKIFILAVGESIGYVLHLHHMIADAWTFHLLVNTISRFIKGENPKAYNYFDYITTEQEYKTSSRYEKDKNYFLSLFEQCREPVYLVDKQAKNSSADYLSVIIDKDDTKSILTFCEENIISPYALFMTTLATYIYRVKCKQNIYIGTAILNRSGRKEKATSGMFINTIPILFHIDEKQNMMQNLQNNTKSIFGTFRHQKYQYNDFLKDVREKFNFTDRLYDVVLSYQNASLDEEIMAQFHFCGQQGDALNIHINDRHQEGLFHMDYTYQTELFSSNDIERLHRHWINLIKDIIESPEKKSHELQLLSEEEYHHVVYGFNNTAVDYPNDKCIHQFFEEQVEQTPDATALIACDETLTFAELNRHSNRIAHALIKRGVKADDVVALILPRRGCYISSMLGILKSGGAYLPLDVNYPRDRIGFMLNDSKAKLVITTSEYIENIEFDGKVLLIDDLLIGEDVDNPNVLVHAEHLFCALHTSGSTGAPKVAALSHENISNFLLLAKPMFTGVDTSLSTTTVSFDVFMQETILALACGIKVVFLNEQELGNQQLFEEKIMQHNNCYLFMTPTKLESYINNSKTKQFMKQIRTFLVGGEVFPPSLYELIHTHKKNNTHNWYGPLETSIAAGAVQLSEWKVVNGYGPIEATVGVSYVDLHSPDITIGKPIANTQIYILDEHLNPMPIGAVGELCISGDGVGLGYLNRPELTAEKFLPNPFLEGKRMYKTGDLACWRDDGQLEYIGRMDNQVKIRGLRIELGEIETAISKFEGIKQVAVVDWKDDDGRQYICAYYISDNDIDEKLLRSELAKTLPRYMVPHFFMRVESFPTTTSGKTDRKAFPSPDFSISKSDVECIAPVTEQEKKLVQIMEAVLGISPIGMNNDFFDIGGDSLKAIELVAKLQNESIEIDLQSIFESPTPAEMISRLAGKDNTQVKYKVEDFDSIHWLLKHGITATGVALEKNPIGDVLITGTTGWLGAHVLDEYLSSESGVAYCLVRSADLTDGKNKLSSVLKHYFGDKYKDEERIVVVCGDIIKQISFDKSIDTIIHCAANVKHYGVYQDSYETNVTGTVNMIALAKEKDAVLIHISTTSVSGDSFEQNPNFPLTIFNETKLYIGQRLDNVYIRSKFEAEKSVLESRLDGIDAVVIRVGNLTNRQSDLAFQMNHRENATLSRLKAFVDLGMYPRQLAWFPIEFSPVDDTARAIIKIAQRLDRVRPMFHLYNDKTVRFGDYVKALKSAYIKMKAVSMKKFIQEVRKTADIPGKAHIYEAFIGDISADGTLFGKSNIRLCNRHTAKYLSEISFDWTEIDNDYLKRYIDYFRNIGYFEV
ncbi:MAG: AMP-binding protein [Oscillospiraceae bacterium]|jgi:thioester reductase-like protein|nr:AMP-binding protein [Oscillospiraceae bacterium]